MKTRNFDIFSTRLSTQDFFVEINHSFILRSQPDRHGKFIVYLLFTQKNFKKEINTKVKVDKKLWKEGRVLPSHENSEDINLVLGAIDAKINRIKVHWRLSERKLTVQKLIEQFQDETPEFDFISFAKHHLKRQNFRPRTVDAQTSILKKLEGYRPVLAFSDIDEDFFHAYRKHLKKKYGNTDTTVQSNFKTIKKYMNIAADLGIKMSMEPKKLKIGKQKTRTVYLLPHEVQELKKYFKNQFLHPSHRLPLAYFLTSCYTGMRISDIQEFKNQLSEDKKDFEQVKTGNFQFMRLNKEIKELLEVTPEFFNEKMSDQKINKNLKTIARICKIDKNLTMHVGRHTFATTWLRNGGGIYQLSKVLGHTDIKTTQGYAHLLESEALEGLDDFITY